MSPQRIQLRRMKGWRKPEGAIVVARPSKWGNPYRLAPWSAGWTIVDRFGNEYSIAPGEHWQPVAVRHYREDLMDGRLDYDAEDVVEQLWGLDLACWCRLDHVCHGDVLLEIANAS